MFVTCLTLLKAVKHMNILFHNYTYISMSILYVCIYVDTEQHIIE